MFPTPPQQSTSSSATFLTNLLDAAAEYAGLVTRFPKTGTIDRIAWRFGAMTTGGNVEARVDTVSVTDGGASGTLYNVSDSLITHAAVTGEANSVIDKAFAVPFAVTQGDLVAIIVKVAAASAFDGEITDTRRMTYGGGILPYLAHFTGTLAKSIAQPNISLRYDDGSWVHFPGSGGVMTSVAVESWDNADNPDERGIKFVAKVGMRCIGCWFGGRLRVANPTFKLYDSAGTLLESRAVDIDQQQSTSSYLFRRIYWTNNETLAKGATFRITLLPGDATNIQNMFVYTFADNAYIESYHGTPIDAVYTSRVDGGTFAETTTKLPLIGIIFDQIDEPAGGGSASILAPNMAGGVVG